MAETTTTDSQQTTTVSPETPASASPGITDQAPATGGIDGDPKKALYLRMKRDNLYAKSFDDFQKQFSTSDKVTKLHQFLTDKGKYDKSSDTFKQQFFPEVYQAEQDELKKKAPTTPASVPGSSDSTAGSLPSQVGGGNDLSSQDNSGVPAYVGVTDPALKNQLQGSDLDALAVAARANQEQAVQEPKLAQQRADQVTSRIDFLTGNDKPVTQPNYSMVTDPVLRQTLINKDNVAVNNFQQQMADAQKAYSVAHPDVTVADQNANNVESNKEQSDSSLKDYDKSHTTWGAIQLGSKYLLSMVTQGMELLGKGAKHLQVDTGDAEYEKRQDAADNAVDAKLHNPLDLNPEFVDKGYPNNQVMNAAGDLAKMVPVFAGGEAASPYLMYLQGVGGAVGEVDQMKKSGVKFENHTDELYIQGRGFINFILGKSVVGRLMGDSGDAVINGASAEATKDLASKGAEVTADDIAHAYLTKALPILDKVQMLGAAAIKNYAIIGSEIGLANVGTTALKQGVDKLNTKPVFNTPNSEYATDISSPFYSGDYSGSDPLTILKNIITSPAGSFSVGGSLMHSGMLFDGSPYKNVVVDNLQRNNSPDNVQAIKANLKAYGEANHWTDDDIANTMTTVDMLSEITKSVPSDLPKQQYRNAVQLIADRRTLEGVKTEMQARKVDLDPSMQQHSSALEKLVDARIDQKNDQLQELVTGKKFTYFEHEGFYFKQQPGEDFHEISKERYDIEQADNTARPNSQKALVMPEGTTDKSGNPVPPPAPKPEETPAAKDITDEDYQKFIEKDQVSKENIASIAQKVRDKQMLSDREKAIFANKTEDVNNWIRESLKPDEKTGENTPAAAKPAEKPAPAPEPAKKPVEKVDEPAEPIKAPAKPETPEAVKSNKVETDGKVDKEGRQNGRQEGLLTPETEAKAGETTTPAFSNEEEADRHWVDHETDPEALAARYHQLNFSTEHTADYKEHQIHNYLGASKINASDFQRYGDSNLLKGDPDFKRRWIDSSNKGLPLDTQAQELSGKSSVEITPQDIVDYISKYKGKNDFVEQAKSPVQKAIEGKYKELTGKDLTGARAEEAYNKGLEANKDNILNDQARDIIEKEGITTDNIDKLRDNFKGFPYTEEDFNNVKRYLDHEREQEKKAPQRGGNNAPASPGSKVESVGGDEPIKPYTGSQRPGKPDSDNAGNTTEQQRISFDPPTQAVDKAKDLQGQINANPDGDGKVSKSVRDKLPEDKKKRFDELRKKIKRNIRDDGSDSGEAFSTEFNHELYSSGIELTSMYFDAGVTRFADYAQEMITDMGKEIVPYLSSFYEGARRLPGQTGPFDSTDAVDYYLAKLDEPQDASRVFIDRVKSEIAAGNKLSILHLEGMADEAGLRANVRTHLQEYVEQGLMEMARDIVEDPFIAKDKIFGELVKLYDKQPSLNQRSSTKVSLQQYSTPIPYAYTAGIYVDEISPERIYDPTAGTGNLTIAFDPSNVAVNEIDPLRVQILKNLGFEPTTEDAATRGALPIPYGGIMTNPPFGPSNTPVHFEGGFTFNKKDYIIPALALKSMKDNGRAAIIIGGHTELAKNGSVAGTDFQFLNYLHHYYNVSDVINVDGGLYSKQGTSFPTRLILINGRKEVPQAWTPTLDITPVKSFEELHDRIQERIKNDENPAVLQSRVDVQPDLGNTNDVRPAGERPAERPDRTGTVSGTEDNEPGGTSIEGKGAGSATDRGQTGNAGDLDKSTGPGKDDNAERQLADVPPEIAKFAAGAEEGTIGPERSGEFIPNDRPVRVTKPDADQLVKNDKIPYQSASRVTDAGSVIPSNMAYETQKNLSDLESLYGPIDAFVANELGYADLDDLANSFFSEQIDALGLAIHQMKQGKAMIIGDMTGIGKGRIAAGLLRYAVQQGKTPFFFTENADLFSDIYRDLHGIGSGHMVPFIVNDPSSDRDANVKREGKVIYNARTIKEKRMFFENKKVPQGTKIILSTYSQLNSDKQLLKRGFVTQLAKDNYLFLDESHNVAGDSNTGKYFQDLLQSAKGAGFFSATYAKRADNMPVYAVKTSMNEANMTSQALVEAIQSGGNALQEIVASQLVKAGQMIRRERDFTGVENHFIVLGQDAKGKLDELGEKHRELADQVIDVANSIIDFEKTFVKPALEDLETELLSKQGKRTSLTKGKELSVNNTPFASKMFNIVNQMLFSIKAPALAQEAIRQIQEHNRKPVISFNSTMESFLKNAGVGPGDHIDDVSFSASLMRGLENTLKYRVEKPNGEKYVDFLNKDDLGPGADIAWQGIVQKIKAASTDMSISPIDTITEILEKAGLKVGEITGRSMKLKYDEDHNGATVEAIGKRDTTGMIHDFNNGGGGGKADVILLNTSGATGFSMHADKSFKDQRQRIMINGQFELDINKEIQKRGRIDRTNQVKRGMYTYVNTAIPAETRLSMMFADKLKQLQANTTSDQRSKANEVKTTDFLNDYGDRIMTQYLRDNPATYEKLFQGDDPASVKDLRPEQGIQVKEGIARRATGRAALLKVAEQEKFYDEVSQAYRDFVDYLNSTDQNNLAVKSINLEAKTLSKGVYITGTHTQSPFGQDSILEKVDANVLRKPLSKEELEEEIKDNLDGQTPREHSRALMQRLRDYWEKVRTVQHDKYNELYQKRTEDNRKKSKGNQEIFKVLQQENLEQLHKNIDYANENINGSLSNINNLFNHLQVGSEHPVPSTISDKGTTYTEGIFLGFHFKNKDEKEGNIFAPSNINVKFAVLDGKRTISVPASQHEFINALYAGRQTMSRSELEQIGNLRNNWDEKVKNIKPRETRYIVTGNILQAYNSTPGQLVSYTTHAGNIEKGILLGKGFNPNDQGKMVGAVESFQKIQSLKLDQELVSSDGVFTIRKNSSINYQIEVPKSTKMGGKYFKSEKIRDIIDFGEFQTYGNEMRATVPDFRLMELLKVLDSEFSMRFSTGIEMEATPGNEDQADGSDSTIKVSKKAKKIAESDENISTEQDNVEHSVIDAKRKERIQAENTLPTGPDGESLPIKKLPDIISGLAKGLNVDIFHAYSKRKGSLGSYNPAAGGIKLSNINNLDTFIHEVGHALDDAFRIYDTIPFADHAQIMDELQWFADRGGSNPPGQLTQGKQIDYLKREGIAEFIRGYVVNEGFTRQKAPLFYKHFLATIPDGVKKELGVFRTDYLRYINGTIADRIWANIEEIPKEQRPAYKRMVESVYGTKDGNFSLSFADHIRTRFTNSMRPFDKAYDYILNTAGQSRDSLLPEENANMLARLFAGIDAKTEAVFTDGLVTGREEPIIDGRTGQRMNLEWLYNAFDTTTEETLKQDKALSVAYMFAERTIEKSMQFDRPDKISGISAAGEQTDTDAAVQFLIKEFGQDIPREQKIRILEGARRYQLWADKTMRYMVDKGRMSESTYQDIKDKNTAYVAFLPVQENQPGIETYFDNVQALTRHGGVGNVKTVIREMTGSTQFKRDPYISLMQNTVAMVKEADRNAISQAFFEPMVNTTRGMGEGRVNPFASIAMEVGKSEAVQGKPVVTVYMNGTPHYFMFNEDAKDVYEYVKGLTKLPQLPGFVTAIPRMIRFTAIHFPVFAARHFVRTTLTRLIITRTGSGFGDFIKDRDGEQGLFKLYGGDQTGYYLSNRVDYYKLQNQVAKDLTGSGKGIVLNPAEIAKGAWSSYEKILKWSDLANRLAERRSAYKLAVAPKSEGGLGYDDHNANMYASLEARDLNDWGVGGTWLRYINAVVPFANVQVQGLKRNIKAVYEGDARAKALFAMRLALFTLLPTLLMRLLAKQGDYEDEYDNLPAYQRDMFWNFKLPGQTGWVSIPKPYDLGLPAAGIDRALGGMEGNENAWNGYAGSVFQNMALMKPELSAGPGAAIVEPITNYSFFKQGPIVPRYEEDKLLYLRKNFNKASRAGKAVSWVLSPLYKEGDSVDPRYIDNMMQSIFSYYGENAMNLSDLGSTESRQKFGLKTTGFIKDQQIMGDTRVEKLYDLAKDLGLTESKPIKIMGALIGEYYNATDPAERQTLHDQIVKMADETYHAWKDNQLAEKRLEQRGKPLDFK